MADTEVCWFSNGTEAFSWQEAWCMNCLHDHGMHKPDGDNGCELLLLAMDRQPIPEWTDKSDEEGATLPAAIYCSRFERCSCPEPDWAAKCRAPYKADLCPVEGCRWQKRRGEDTCYVHREETPEVDRRASQIVRQMLIAGLAQSPDEEIREGAAEEITKIEQTLFDG